MSLSIEPYSPDHNYSEISKVFFTNSTVKEFDSVEKRDAFKFKYLDDYLENYAEFCFVLKEHNYICGYVIASNSTFSHLKQFPYYSEFEIELTFFPAHLHINLLNKAQDKAVG